MHVMNAAYSCERGGRITQHVVSLPLLAMLFASSELRRMPNRRSSWRRESLHRGGPMGQDFSGSCSVTSRNPLIQVGATNGTKSERFDAKGVLSCCSRVLSDVPRVACYRELRRILFKHLGE